MSTSSPGGRHPSLHPAFIAALEEEREQINQRFKLASLEGSPLDGQAFQTHLATRAEPIVAAVHDCLPERTRVVTLTLVNISLQLFRSGFWSAESRLPLLDELWERVLPKLARFVARDPERVVGSLSNALINLAGRQPTTAATWLERIELAGDACSSVTELLDAGRIAAWLAGRADMRFVALELLTQLPKQLTCKLIELDSSTSQESLVEVVERLRADTWGELSPNMRKAELRIVKRVGAFKGFGGEFQTPPIVSFESGQFFVSDAYSRWRMMADRFGAVLERVSQDSRNTVASPVKDARNQPELSASGDVTWGAQSKRFLQLASSTSQAFDGRTLAVTLANSFHVILITC